MVSIMALMLLQIGCFAVTVETTTNLNVYYPEYAKIDLVCRNHGVGSGDYF